VAGVICGFRAMIGGAGWRVFGPVFQFLRFMALAGAEENEGRGKGGAGEFA